MRLTKTNVRPPRSDLSAYVGRQLFALRKVTNNTMQAVAKGSGLSMAFISQVENGQSSPTVESLWKLAQYFGVEIGYFVNGYEDENSGGAAGGES